MGSVCCSDKCGDDEDNDQGINWSVIQLQADGSWKRNLSQYTLKLEQRQPMQYFLSMHRILDCREYHRKVFSNFVNMHDIVDEGTPMGLFHQEMMQCFSKFNLVSFRSCDEVRVYSSKTDFVTLFLESTEGESDK